MTVLSRSCNKLILILSWMHSDFLESENLKPKSYLTDMRFV